MLTEQMRSDEVLGREETKAKLAEDLASRLGEEVVVEDVPDLQQFGHVDDYYVSFECRRHDPCTYGALDHGRPAH